MNLKPHSVAEIFPGMNQEDYARLKADIAQKGQLQPITITTDGKIIDGRHRYQAMVELGLLEDLDFVEVPSDLAINEMTDLVTSLNLCRRHLSTGQRALIGARVQKVLEQWQKSNPEAAKEALKGERRQIAGDMVGVNGQTIQQAKNVLDRGVKELQELCEQGQAAVSDAVAVTKLAEQTQREVVERFKNSSAKTLREVVKAVKREQQVKEVAEAPLPEGRYAVIVADPPWTYDKRKHDETQRGKTPYPTMTPEEIRNYPVPAAEDCVLWLWTTNAHMGEAMGVLEAWGFSLKTILTWAKPRIGVGDWLRGQTEHCLLAARGQGRTLAPGNRSTLLAAPVAEHSCKPEAFYALVEALTPGASKCELFARKQRDGWAAFGAELPHEHPAPSPAAYATGAVL